MKSYAYTARDSSGATTSGHLSADDRAGAVREIRARGLVPLSIEEGAAPAGGARGLPGARVIALAAGALLAAVALVALLARRPAPPPAPKPADTTGTTVATGTAGTTGPPAATPATPRPAGKAVPPQAAAGTRPAIPRPAVPAGSAAPAVPAPPAAPAAAEESPEPPQPHVYKTLTEQLLAMVGRPGEVMPPLPISGTEDLAANLKEALTNLIEIYEDDDAHTVNRKETVAWLKIQLAEADKEGWNPAEVIKALEEQRQEEAAIRKEAARRFQEMRRENPDKAREIRAAINAELAEQGILPLDPPIRPRRK